MTRTFTDHTLETVKRFSHILGPISYLADRVLDHVAPKVIARAQDPCIPGGNVYCRTSCDFNLLCAFAGWTSHAVIYALPGQCGSNPQECPWRCGC